MFEFFFFNFQSCSDVFEYISSSNWPIFLNKHSNWRQLNPLQLFILKFSNRPSILDASNFNKLDFLAKIEIENSHIALGRIEIGKIANLLKSLASEIFKIESCRRFSCLQFECLFIKIGQLELEIYSKTSKQLCKLKKKFEHLYLENASIKKNLECDFRV